MIDEKNSDLVHHLLLHECNPSFHFDDNNLPDGICNELIEETEPCATIMATGWAVGGGQVLFTKSKKTMKRIYFSLSNFLKKLNIPLV